MSRTNRGRADDEIIGLVKQEPGISIYQIALRLNRDYKVTHKYVTHLAAFRKLWLERTDYYVAVYLYEDKLAEMIQMAPAAVNP